MGMGEKPRKNSPFGCHPHFYSIEADSFSVSKNTENKPDLR